VSTCGRLGDRDVVAVLDETGDVKKGTHTVGVQRQYTGTAGRIENSQVAVFLSYGTDRGHTLVDAELYLPKPWTGDPDRCAAARVPSEVEFTTKPALALKMVVRALDAGLRLPWVIGDEVYGADPGLRAELESRGIGYVLAVAANLEFITAGLRRARVDDLVAGLPTRAWRTLSAGDGAKGLRYYDWARVAITAGTAGTAGAPAVPGRRWLLARRNRSTGELTYYLCFSTKSVPWATLVHIAGRRWSIEENFQAAKTLVGLDQHQVRTWTSWRR
jgi:SRSO17 transposase